jgi:acetolactate synthase-1/2/3 large subunit
MHYPVYAPRTFISSGYQGTLGGGFATALGAKLARPEVPVVAIVGDGGFMYTMPELATAVLHDIPVVAVVFNNAAFGNVKLIQQRDYGGRVIATDLANPDFVQLARSFGIAGIRVSTPAGLGKALASVLGADRPALIEVAVGEMPDPWPLVLRPRIR